MRLRHIEAFNAVMLTGSVTDAARLLNVTQSAVSKVLQHAELQLGFKLFQRAKGRLVPTDEALTLYPRVEQLFRQLEDVQRLAASLRAGDGRQELHVLAALSLSLNVVPRAIERFRRRHGAVRISVKAMHSAEVVAALALQEADIGFVFSAPEHPALVAERVGEGRLVCVGPPGRLPATRDADGAVPLASLAGHPLVGIDAQDPIGRSLNQACRELGLGLDFAMTVQTYHAALAFAEHGLGLALVDSFTARSAHSDRVEVAAVAPRIPVMLSALRPAARPAPVVAQAFVQCLRQVAADPTA